MSDQTQPSRSTVTHERAEAEAEHAAPQRPDEGEARAAEEAERDLDGTVGEHYREMTDKGAKVKGEGAI